MALRLADKWIWDFWLARDGADHHVFYLQAPRALGHADLRHFHPTIGHAVSQDLEHWQVLPDALAPRTSTAWDDYTTWTGSVVRHAGTWFMFYTGTSRADEGLVQRIGLATSSDLVTWERYGETPRLWCLGGEWYERLDRSRWSDEAWRDPWVFEDQSTGDWHAYFTARAAYGPADGRGVIGHARSRDLLDWELLSPVTRPGDFAEVEIPQLVKIEERWYLFFSTLADAHSAARRARLAQRATSGTHYFAADSPFGPFAELTEEFLVGDESGALYGGRAVELSPGDLRMLFWRWRGADGTFLGELTDPAPLFVDRTGRLHVDTRALEAG